MSERQLATIRSISEIKPIEGRDKICLYHVNGWQIIDTIGKYEVGDLVIFLEIDSWVPSTLAPFLSKGKEPREFEGIKGERLKTIRMGGVLSQGLLLPLTVLGEPHEIFTIGDGCIGADVTEQLGILKWEKPIPAQLRGQVRGNFPSEIPKTDAIRIQNIREWEVISKTHTFEVTEKLHGCFLGKQLIETWDSGTVKIADIVNKGIRPKLIGVDEFGNPVPTEITKVFNNGVKTKWVDVYFDTPSKAMIVGKSGKLRCTVNHKIFLSDMSEIPAQCLKHGDEVLMTSVDLDQNGIHYIQSSMLGDGCIGGNGHFSFNEAHATKYPNYLNYIKSIFKNINTSSRIQVSGYGSEMEYIKVFSTKKMKEMREKWYDCDGKIRLPNDLSWVDDFTIAKWYIDDGSLSHSEKQNDRANLATQAFSQNDCIRLCDKLKEMYGVDAVLQIAGKGCHIRINYGKGTIEKFWEAIAPHVIQEQRYKLPEKYRNYPFKPYPTVKYERNVFPVKILKVIPLELNKRNFPSGSVGYDIETTTHNYFCGGILVHNSSCTFYLDDEYVFHVCSRNLDLKEDENNAYWKVARKLDIENKMRLENMQGCAIQGELVGEGINGNQYGIKGLDFYVFNIYGTNNKAYFSSFVRTACVGAMGLKQVPELGVVISSDIQEMLELAEGKSLINGSEREGFVLKSQRDTSLIIKVISNKWLLGGGDDQ